jgi:hypothetical protein
MGWTDLVDTGTVIVLLPVVFWLALLVRRRLIARGGATFECSLRRADVAPARGRRHPIPGGWMLGMGRYSGERMEWFRAFSVVPRPRFVIPRSAATTHERRIPEPVETHAVLSGRVILSVDAPTGPVELAMSDEALTGFLAWTEAAPPGPPRIAL